MIKNLLIPKWTSNDEEVKIIEWLVENKRFVKSGERILNIETSKTFIDVECESSGYILQKCKSEDIIAVGNCYGKLFESLTELEAEANKDYNPVPATETAPMSESLETFSKSALKYILDNNLRKEDFLNMGLVTVEKIKTQIAENVPPPQNVNSRDFPKLQVEPASFSKLAEISKLSRNKEGVLMSSLTVQLFSEEIRRRFHNVSWMNRRILTYILYVFSMMLEKNPHFTSYYSDKKIHLYNRVNLGLAIDLGKGLKVLVIEDSNTLSLFDLQMSIIESMSDYHENTNPTSTLKSPTVTVTDLSQDNILHFQPILNENQSIILGIGGDQNLPGSPLSLTIVFDHRVLSGQEVASFLKQFKDKLLEEDASLIY